MSRRPALTEAQAETFIKLAALPRGQRKPPITVAAGLMGVAYTTAIRAAKRKCYAKAKP